MRLPHPAVAEAAVLAIPHPRCRTSVLVVLRRDDVSAAELRAHLAELVPKWWLPDSIVFVSELAWATGNWRKTYCATGSRKAG